MAAPSLDVDWSAIRSAAESGVPFDKLSMKFGVKLDTIRQKAHRQGWILLKDVLKGAKLPLSQAATMNVTKAKKEPPKVSKQEIVELVQESWAEQGDSYRRMMAAKLVPLIKRAPIAEPKNWKDLEIADKLARKALGLESGDNQVNVAVIGGTNGFDDGMSWAKGGSFGAQPDYETNEPPAVVETDGE